MADAHSIRELLQAQIDALNKRIDELDRLSVERVAHIRENINLALTSADKAISKAEVASERRFDSVNEFRAALTDQTQSFVRSSEYSLSHTTLLSKVDLLSNQIISIDTTVKNRMASTISGPAMVIGLSAVGAMMIISVITGAIKLGIDQNQIDNVRQIADQLVMQTRDISKESARQDVLIETIRSRQELNIDRIKKLEEKQ